MAIDMNKAKQRMAQLQTQRKDFSKISYALKYGENILRFVTPEGAQWPFLEGSWYSGGKLSKQYFISPSMYGEPDPIIQQLDLLKNSGSQDAANDAKKLYPTRRVFGLVVVRGQQDKGIRWIDFPQKVEKQLVTFILNTQYGDITDEQNGTDFIITKTKGNPFPEYSVVPKRKSSPMFKTQVEIDQAMNNIPDFKDAFKHHTYEELEEIWNKYLEDDGGVATTSDDEQPIPDSEQTVNVQDVLSKFKRNREQKKAN